MVKMNKGGIVAPKMGSKPSHKAKKNSKSIAKKIFQGYILVSGTNQGFKTYYK